MLEESIRDSAGVMSSQACGETKPELHLLSEGHNHVHGRVSVLRLSC